MRRIFLSRSSVGATPCVLPNTAASNTKLQQQGPPRQMSNQSETQQQLKPATTILVVAPSKAPKSDFRVLMVSPFPFDTNVFSSEYEMSSH